MVGWPGVLQLLIHTAGESDVESFSSIRWKPLSSAILLDCDTEQERRGRTYTRGFRFEKICKNKR